MKDSLFEFLFTLFASSLSQSQTTGELLPIHLERGEEGNQDFNLLHVHSYDKHSTRVLTLPEHIKMTKKSHQFLMRLKLWGIIDEDAFEFIMNQIQYSKSHLVTLQEMQYIVKRTLMSSLPENHEAFLDLILSPRKDKAKAH